MMTVVVVAVAVVPSDIGVVPADVVVAVDVIGF